MGKFIILCVLFVILCVCFALLWIWRPVSATHPTLVTSNMPAAIPLRDFYANQDSEYGYTLSSDGKKLTWLEIKWFKPILKIKDLDTGDITSLRPPKGFLTYQWAADQKTILFALDTEGREYRKLASLDTSQPNAELHVYDFGEKTSTFIQHIPQHHSDTINIAHNERDPSSFDMYRLNLKTGETEPLGARLGNATHYAIDAASNIIGRFIYPTAQSGDWYFEVPTDTNTWEKIASGNYKDTLNLSNQIEKDGHVYALSNRGRDKASLVKLNLKDGSETFIYSDPDVDLHGVEINPLTNELQMATSYPDYQKRHYFDKAFEADVASLNLPKNASYHSFVQTSDLSKSLVFSETPQTAFSTILIDRDKKISETISTAALAKHKDKFSQIDPVFIKARDGLDIPAFLSRPKGVNDGPAPLVILIHGGPVSHTGWIFKTLRAFLNNRGYAVLDVNYRGSSGYGRKFMEAAKGEVAGKMSTDIIDARAWAVDEGIADPDKVALYGGSWGGFEVLTALTQNSDLFAAGISINGVADLSTMLDEVPDYWRGWPQWLVEFVGDPKTQAGNEELIERSPITHAAKMTTPLLLLQAANDARVVQGQSDRMVKKLKASGAPVEYVLLKGVGHNPDIWPWQMQYLEAYRMERFLSKHLGGRTGGYDYAILGAYILP